MVEPSSPSPLDVDAALSPSTCILSAIVNLRYISICGRGCEVDGRTTCVLPPWPGGLGRFGLPHATQRKTRQDRRRQRRRRTDKLSPAVRLLRRAIHSSPFEAKEGHWRGRERRARSRGDRTSPHKIPSGGTIHHGVAIAPKRPSEGVGCT